MRESLFSSLKVVAMMLIADNLPHPREKKWLLQIARNYGASFSELAALSKILAGNSQESLSEIVSHVQDEFDKRRLLNFLQMAMRQDGIVKNTEIQLFYEIQKELETNLRNDYVKMGREIRKRDNEVRLWSQLNRLGRVLSHKYPGFPFSGYYYYVDLMLWSWILDGVAEHWGKLLAGLIILVVLAKGFGVI